MLSLCLILRFTLTKLLSSLTFLPSSKCPKWQWSLLLSLCYNSEGCWTLRGRGGMWDSLAASFTRRGMLLDIFLCPVLRNHWSWQPGAFFGDARLTDKLNSRHIYGIKIANEWRLLTVLFNHILIKIGNTTTHFWKLFLTRKLKQITVCCCLNSSEPNIQSIHLSHYVLSILWCWFK